MKLPRRAVLGGALAVAMSGRGAAQGVCVDLRAALDAAAADKESASALARLAPFREAGLPPSDRLDLRAARAGLAIDAELAKSFPFGRGRGLRPYRVTPFDGAWRSGSPEAVDADTRAIEADGAAGIILPRVWLERMLAALAVRMAGDKVKDAATMAALSRQGEALAALLPHSPMRQGLGQLPQGERWFALLAARTGGATGSLAVCEARLIALRDSLHRQAEGLFASIGVKGETVGACFRQIWADPAGLYADDEQGHAQAVEDMTRQLAIMRARLRPDFAPLPDWCLDARVRALSAQDIAAGRKGFREVPTPGHPGAYIVDLQTIRLRPRWSLPAVVAHELLPGHMVQLGFEGLHPPHPLRRLYAASFAEGWGIYAEHLADREGAYADPRVQLGAIHWHLFRVCRALVDLGIHLHGWSHEEARAKLEAWQGVAAYFAPFDQDLDRIALEPGLHLAEVLSAMAITEKAAPLSGSALRAFHMSLIRQGSRRIEDMALT